MSTKTICKSINFIKAFTVITVAFLLNVTTVSAQDGPEQLDDDLGGETTTVPFDGGVNLLIAMAVVYGARKLYEAKKIAAEGKDEAVCVHS